MPVYQYYLLEPVALAATILLTYFNHTRTRRSSTILLLFWPLYLLLLGLWTRTILQTRLETFRHILVLKGVTVGLGLIAFLLECAGPEPEGPKANEESPLVTANIFSVWVSSHSSPDA